MSSYAGAAVRPLIDSFFSLRRAWQATPQAAGGLNAMAGFDFQLSKAVHSIIRQEVEGRGETFVEVLSDIVEHDDGFLIAQAKRTLTSGTFRSALDELWGIERLAASQTPELLPHLRYQVQSSRRSLEDWAGSMDRWSPQSADATALATFKKKVTVAVSPSPRIEAAKLLVDEFKDTEPFDRIDRTIGRFVIASATGLDGVVQQFRVELGALRNQTADQERRFGVWGVADRPPDTVDLVKDKRQAVRIGERLTVADLRDGRLARRAVYGEIDAGCESWLNAEPPLYKLPVFWIAGRSGCGKSAALLHAAAHLHDQDPDRLVLWLGPRAEMVSAAVRWAQRPLKEGRTVVIVLDDPFTADRQQAFVRSTAEAQAEIEAMSSSPVSSIRSPMLLCCGPTEQRAAAEDACGSHLAFDGFDMPIETIDDRSELARWYEARTGDAVPPMDGNVLLVQQMFEWTLGEIGEFAHRFRKRIQAFDAGRPNDAVFDSIAGILALNRLYVDFPAAELDRRKENDPNLESALIRLGEEEAHFEFQVTDGSGVRLTHPHLADRIYRTWFGRSTDRPFRKAHLAASLAAALGQSDEAPEIRHAPLWAISRLAQPRDRFGREIDSAMRARIDLIRVELREVLQALYKKRTAGMVALEDLPVWVGLDHDLELNLAPAPADLLAEAVAAATEPSRGLRLSSHRLLGIGDQPDRRHVEAVAACLTKLAHWRGPNPWHEWTPLALDFVGRVGAEALLAPISDLSQNHPRLRGMSQLMDALAQGGPPDAAAIVIEWLQRTLGNEFGWGQVLSSLIDSHGHSRATDPLTQRLLAGQFDEPVWPRIWASSLEAGRGDVAALLEEGRVWLGLNRERSGEAVSRGNLGWDRVWQPLFERAADADEIAALTAAGFEMIRAADARSENWTRVWPILWEKADDPARDELVDLAVERLGAARASLMGWSYVWLPALRASGGQIRLELLRLGTAWLDEADSEHLGWGFVLEGLFEAGAAVESERVKCRAREWLAQAGDEHRGWGHVWLKAMAAAEGETERIDLARIGADWLARTSGDHPGWSRVSEHLLTGRFGEHTVRARALTKRWLYENMEYIGWPKVIQVWCDTSDSPEDRGPMRQFCLDRLDDAATPDNLWMRLWFAARHCGAGKSDSARRAAVFIADGRGTEGARASLCARSLKLASDADRSTLKSAGMALLSSPEAGKSWASLWYELSQLALATDKRTLIAMAADWLVDVGPENAQWSRVFLRASYLDRSFPVRPAVAADAAKWLGIASGSDKWIKVWVVLPGREQLLDTARIAAAATVALEQGLGEAKWGHLWRAAFPALDGPERQASLDLAAVWLRHSSNHPGFNGVWRAVLGAESLRREEMLALGFDALGRSPIIPDWFSLLGWFLKFEPMLLKTPSILAAAVEWLSVSSGKVDGWLRVMRWREPHEPSPWSDPAVLRSAEQWLESALPTDRAWSLIWRAAVGDRPISETNELIGIGERWLRKAPTHHQGWPYVWMTVWHAKGSIPGARASLRPLGSEWLRRQPEHKAAKSVASRLASGSSPAPKRKTPGVAAGGR